MSVPGSCCQVSDLWLSICQAIPPRDQTHGSHFLLGRASLSSVWSSVWTWLPLLCLHPFPHPSAVSLPLHLPLEAGPGLDTASGVPPGAAPVSFCSGCSPHHSHPTSCCSSGNEVCYDILRSRIRPCLKHMGWGGRSTPLGAAHGLGMR